MRCVSIAGPAAGAVLASCAAAGAMAEASKSRYWLFDPTPDAALRDMSTDRPDTTESAFTVDAGRVQIESGLFGFSRSRREADGGFTDSYSYAETNVRVGLANDVEVALVWQPYGVVRTRGASGAAPTRRTGIGGVELRGKVNLWGNDEFGAPGTTALALLPFVTLPTDRRNGVGPAFAGGGAIVPFAVQLSDAVGLGLNGGLEWSKEDDAEDRRAQYVATASVSVAWTERLGGYYEVAARFAGGSGKGDAVSLGTGVTFALADNVQLDAGVNVGVTPAADRFNPFVGLSVRF
jgi:hypothetical protein